MSSHKDAGDALSNAMRGIAVSQHLSLFFGDNSMSDWQNKEAQLVTLTNSKGVSVQLSTWGATLVML